MKRNIHSYCIFCLLILALNPVVIAQILEVEALDRNTGMVSNALTEYDQGIAKDGFGYIWIVGEVSLSRYDGYEIKNYAKISSSDYDIPNRYMNNIIVDEDDNLWIGTRYDGVIFFDRKKEAFINLDEIITDTSAYLAQIAGLLKYNSKLIVATFLDGVFAFDIENKTSEEIRFGNNKGRYQILDVDTTSHGELIFRTFTGVVIKGIEGEEFYPNIKGRSVLITDIEEIENDQFLVEYENPNDTYLIDRRKNTFTKFTHDNSVQSSEIFRMDRHSLWRFHKTQSIDVLNNSGEVIDSVSTIEFDEHINSLLNIESDLSGNLIYYSTYEGAGKIILESPIFSYLPENKYIGAKQIHDKVYFYNSKEIYNVTDNKVFPIYPENIYLHNFHINKEDKVFMSSYNLTNGIMDTTFMNIYNADRKRIDKHQARLQEYIEEFHDGRVITESNDWPAFKKQDLGYTSAAEIYEEYTGEDFLDKNARFFIQTSNGDVWITTYNNGTVRIYDDFKKIEQVEFDTDQKGLLNHEGIYFAYENDNNQVFFATERNINVYDMDTETFSYLNLEEDYVDNIIGMGHTENGDMFFLTERFIYRLDTLGNKLKIRLPEKYRTIYSKTKDLVIKDNFIYYSGIGGLVQVSIDELNSQRAPENPIVTDFYMNRNRIFPNDDTEILDSSILFQKDITLDFKDRDLGFQFVSIDGKILDSEYHFKLHGFDKEWTTTMSDRTVHYTNVDPGKYQFEVKVKSGAGKWSAESVIYNIRVKRPWYSTILAYLIYFLSVFGIFYAIYRYRIHQLTRYQNLRTKISSDLHDDVGTLLSSVAMQSEVLGLNAPPEKLDRFKRLSNMSREAMGRMRDTVWAIDSEKDNVDSLVDRMQDYLTDMNEGDKFEIVFDKKIAKMSSSISPDVRQNIYLIFKEAVNNAFKYSKGDQLLVKLNHSSKNLELEIYDNGKVNTAKIKTSGTGMRNMKMRAKRIDAVINIELTDGFRVHVKLSN